MLQNYNKAIGDERLFLDDALLKAAGYDAIKAGAALLGKDAARILTPSTLSAARKIISDGIEKGNLLSQVGTGLKLVEPDNQISVAEELLRAFLNGLQKKT